MTHITENSSNLVLEAMTPKIHNSKIPTTNFDQNSNNYKHERMKQSN